LQNTFRIGESHYIEPSLNSVTGPAGAIRLEPKVMQVLVCLAENAGEVVSKERLMRSVWRDAFVGDDVLPRCISELPRVFGDDAKEPRFIQTIPKNG
jgi:DNA-binding winged helix-turn-helix (wHTH) protein